MAKSLKKLSTNQMILGGVVFVAVCVAIYFVFIKKDEDKNDTTLCKSNCITANLPPISEYFATNTCSSGPNIINPPESQLNTFFRKMGGWMSQK